MTNVRLTPDAHPTQIEKTLRYEAPHTSEVMNRIQEELIGSTKVLNGFQVVQTADGTLDLYPGSFIADGVIVTLKTKLVVGCRTLPRIVTAAFTTVSTRFTNRIGSIEVKHELPRRTR